MALECGEAETRWEMKRRSVREAGPKERALREAVNVRPMRVLRRIHARRAPCVVALVAAPSAVGDADAVRPVRDADSTNHVAVGPSAAGGLLEPVNKMSPHHAGRRKGGFTLIELMIVVVIIAILCAVAVPNMISARIQANEASAIAVLRSVTTAESQFQRSSYVDMDQDGTGEYGVFGEMAGQVAVRGGGSKAPTDLTATMATVTGTGEVKRSGYVFRMYLPGAAGVGVQEQSGGGVPLASIDTDLAENRWACYAYPQSHDSSGHRTFFANEHCELTYSEDPRYTIAGCVLLKAGAAFVVGDIANMTGPVAIGTRGADGNIWKPVQ
jgi:prepilin-type N-terminal cleavage/methylation domain-containing protein